MWFLLKVAIRNVLKQRRRSLAILLAIIISVALMQFFLGFIDGFMGDFMETAFDNIGHITIHATGYSEKSDMLPLQPSIYNWKQISKKLEENPNIVSVDSNITFGSLLISDLTNLTMLGKGIETKRGGLKHFEEAITQGRFIEKDGEIIVGEPVAELLKAKLGDEIILLTNDVYDSFAGGKATLVGLFKTNIAGEDEYNMFITLPDSQVLLALEDSVTEMNIKLTDPYLSKPVLKEITPIVKEYGLEALAWQETNAFLIVMTKIIDYMMLIFMVIIFTVAGSSIINTMLTSIFERTREIGTMRAIGFSRGSIMFSFLTEALILGILGSLIGTAIGSAFIAWFYYHPMVFENVSDMVEGFGAVYRTGFTLKTYLICFCTGVGVAFLGAFYPAYLAVKMKPIDALRENT
ncbi:MAG: FtsX-like permease family protein [Candidatus Margulisbacteria bacterium]|nr:FtsX-like permease family protein [Candidatus Margulisiibacteriota bacterium]MBU1021142.1 FtsX-like permease family protein [Candidatus Margulisiibacteriota bacterium]MBU1729748.1 FtsX-like permease family protein [Candidatus Margulisiibacteriota bacterium]MBU1955249.1 FtsX-like permease family protein [Candidatus Margulisiibacteriota bacterium]